MKKTFLIASLILMSSISALAIEPCLLDATKIPKVTIFPGKGTVDNESLTVVFRNPGEKKGDPEVTRYIKIRDKDGSANILLLNYLIQDSSTDRKQLSVQIYDSLIRRQAYWRAEQKKAEVAEDSARMALIETSLQMTDFILRSFKRGEAIADKELQSIIKDVIGPMTDYDEVTKYEYSEYDFKKRGYVEGSAKRMSEILPKEFYELTSSSSSSGVVDFSKVGKSTCHYLPVEGGKEGARATDPDSRGKGKK